jgi:hypothetical protein
VIELALLNAKSVLLASLLNRYFPALRNKKLRFTQV